MFYGRYIYGHILPVLYAIIVRELTKVDGFVRLITKVDGFDGFHIGPILIGSYIARAPDGPTFFWAHFNWLGLNV